MSSVAKQYYTPEEYLALERKAEYKSEYINGQIIPLYGPHPTYGSQKEHSAIVVNLIGELHSQLKGRPDYIYNNDVRVNATGKYTNPDITIVCGEPHFENEQLDTITNPTVIIEVLSPSTEGEDRGDKFAHYRKMPSLTDYVLVSQDTMLVEHFARSDDSGDQWLLTVISNLDNALHLTSIGCTVNLRDIYDKVAFPSSQPTE